MTGSRSNLVWEMLRVISELRPAVVVWENVPGLSSSDDGRDFARVLVSLRERGYLGAARIIDAQYDGLAQRRRRWFGVFFSGHSGAERAAEVLLIRKGLRGNPPPSRKAGQGIAGTVAPCLRSGGCGTERVGDSRGQDCVVPVVGTLCADTHPGSYSGQDAYQGKLIAQPVASALNCMSGIQDPDIMNYVVQDSAFTLAARDGKGANSNANPGNFVIGIIAQNGSDVQANTSETTGTLDCGYARQTSGDVLAFSSKDSGNDVGELSPTLRAMNHDKSHSNGGGQVAVIAMQERMESANPDNGPNGKGYSDEGVAFTMEARNRPQSVAAHFGVRRLVPVECCRLQGFPDNWMDGLGLSDSQKYRLLGNAVAVPCAKWIGERIVSSFESENQ